MDRRSFLSSTAASAAVSAVAASNAGAQSDEKNTSAQVVGGQQGSGKVPRVGLIGCGWYGKCDLFRLLQVANVEVISLCDVDQKMLEEAGTMVAARQPSGKKPRLFSDYREMLKPKDLDIVLIGTPDHWHALQMIAAVEAGADVYVQKPTSVDVVESQAMLAAARKNKRVVQVGTQRRSTPHLINAREKIVKPGLLGKVGLVEVYCYYHMRARSLAPNAEPPAHLDYDMWTGPAPMRPYNSLVHPRRWRAFMEYSNGILGDMCVHMLDMSRWAAGPRLADTCEFIGRLFLFKKIRSPTRLTRKQQRSISPMT